MRTPWKEILTALLIGAAVGWFAAVKFDGHSDTPRKPGKMMDRFATELRLSPDQRSQVSAIMEQKRQQITALRSEVRPQFESIRNTAKLEIRKVLTPEQLVIFNKLERRWDEARQKRRARWS